MSMFEEETNIRTFALLGKCFTVLGAGNECFTTGRQIELLNNLSRPYFFPCTWLPTQSDSHLHLARFLDRSFTLDRLSSHLLDRDNDTSPPKRSALRTNVDDYLGAAMSACTNS